MWPLKLKRKHMKKDSIQKLFSLKSVFAVVVLSMVAVLFACELRDEEPAMTEEQIEIKEAVENTNAQLKTVSGPVFFVVEEMPEYPGGEEALRMFIATSVKYPAEAQKAGVSGRVYVSFIVDDNGNVNDVKLAKSSGFSMLDEEAIRVISEMPRWTPGKQRGQAVNVSYTVPINFQLNDDKVMDAGSTQKKGVDFKDMTEEQKNQIIEQYRAKGWDVSFNENGSLDMKKIVTENGTGTVVK